MDPTSEQLIPSEELKRLVLDDVTGEQVSKTELKKRNKQRETAARKAEKAAQAPPATTTTKRKQNAEEEEEQLNPNQYYEAQTRAVKRMKENHDDPYPDSFQPDTNMKQFFGRYESLKTGEEKKDIEVRVAGRIMNIRSSSTKLRFYDAKIQGYKIQVMCQANNATDDIPFENQHEPLQIGSIIGVIGFPGRTNPRNRSEGELSIFARQVVLLSPCLHLLPGQHFGLTDIETRFRQRYLDLIVNEESSRVMRVRSDVISYVRHYFDSNDFKEVETPMLSKIAGGAIAKPFTTFYNAYKQEVYLRIAPELYLKQLIIGDMEKVYELGKQFRNEDADLTHNPEFTTCEYYEAYSNVNRTMERTEELVSGLVEQINARHQRDPKSGLKSHETIYHTQHGEEYKVDWSRPWKRIDMIPALEKATGETFPPSDQLHTQETNDFLRRILKKMDVECPSPLTNARMVDRLVGEFIESTCVNPTFITGHPEMMSPLAKADRARPGLTQRAEAFVCKKEIANMYTELNDPVEQRRRFEEQMLQKAAGDEEAGLPDWAFITAMEYALPPTGGWGLGIDRLVMFLTDKHSIREVLAFPYMKEVVETKEPKRDAPAFS